MSTPAKTLSFSASSAPEAQAAREDLVRRYGNAPAAEADVIIALGGDGFMLHTLHDTISSGKAIYGMNCGSVGFLMNDFHADGLLERIDVATENVLRPLQMKTTNADGTSRSEEHTYDLKSIIRN